MEIASLILVGAFLGLLFSRIFSKKDDYGTFTEQMTVAANTPASVEKIAETNVNGTPLDKEHVRQAIIFNGFVPHESGDGWFAFKIQGETYCCSYDNGPLMQFYKGYRLDMNDVDYHHELCIKASETVLHNSLMGRVTFDDDKTAPGIAFRATGIEMTYEHLCVSFMEYIHLIENLYAQHRYEYSHLCEVEDIKAAPFYIEPSRNAIFIN